MSSAANRRATYQDVLATPPHLVAQVVRGTLITMPRPAARHARASSMLGGALFGFNASSGGPGGWVILDEPELHLSEDILVPDLAGWRRERMPELPDAAFFTLAPDWLCEVLSPSTAQLDRADKVPLYGAAGVPHLWLVDPLAQTLEVLRLDGTTYRLLHTFSRDQVVRAPPFEPLELQLSMLWSR